MLRVSGVSKRFGGLRAVDDVSMQVHEGEVLGLIGPNGSGKTTLLNILSGLLPADTGEVFLDEKNVSGMPAVRLARLGVMRMFQMTRVFDRMSAYDNLVVCGLAQGLRSVVAHGRAAQLLEELRLEPVMFLDAGQLSGGQRKLLEFGACFMATPRIALLDESFAAVHPTMKQIMSEFIRRRNAAGQTFVLVSHDMPVVVDLCRRAVCMNAGRVLAHGSVHEVLNAPAVIEAYLGEDVAPEADHG